MTELEKRAAEFREKHQLHKIKPTAGFAPLINAFELIAEIKWARENPPAKFFLKTHTAGTLEEFEVGVDMMVGWMQACEHLLACLGEK